MRGIALLGGAAVLFVFALTFPDKYVWATATQEALNENLAAEGVSQPIQLCADDIATWAEGGQQIFLLQGGLVVKQGSTTVRSSDGVVWVDMARYQTERVMHVIVYGENPMCLERNQAARQADYGYVRLATSNKIDIKAFKSKVAKEDRTVHPVYQRAQAELVASGQWPVASGKLLTTSHSPLATDLTTSPDTPPVSRR